MALRTNTRRISPGVDQPMLMRTPRNEIPEPTDVPWSEFIGSDLDWRQGEHVTIAAPTGWGKTTLGLAILPKREFVCILGTKPEDEKFADDHGYRIVTELPLPPVEMYPRVLFWPKNERVAHIQRQKTLFRDLLMELYHVGGYCVFVDELDYICNFLGLKPLVELLWRQGRSLGVSVVGGTQRPAFIPLLAYDQASHLFIGRDNDETNIRRYASIAGGGKETQRVVKQAIATLPYQSFLYLNTRGKGGGYIRTKVTV